MITCFVPPSVDESRYAALSASLAGRPGLRVARGPLESEGQVTVPRSVPVPGEYVEDGLRFEQELLQVTEAQASRTSADLVASAARGESAAATELYFRSYERMRLLLRQSSHTDTQEQQQTMRRVFGAALDLVAGLRPVPRDLAPVLEQAIKVAS